MLDHNEDQEVVVTCYGCGRTHLVTLGNPVPLLWTLYEQHLYCQLCFEDIEELIQEINDD